MKLRRISVEAFRSFVEPSSTAVLPERGLGLIRGVNHDTGGSSGAGKTTLALAVAHALKFCHYPSTALQSWLTDTKMQVRLDLELPDGRAVVLKVGKETSVQVEGEPEVKGSAVAVQEKVQSLTGLAPELLKHLTYRPQKTPGLFLSMTDSEKKEFLSTLLGLEELEGLAETATKRANEIQKQADVKNAVLDSLLNQLDAVVVPDDEQENEHTLKVSISAKERMLATETKGEEEARAELAKFEKSIAEVKDRLRRERDEILRDLRAKHDVARKERKPFVPTAQDTHDALKREFDAFNAQVNKLDQEERDTRKALLNDLTEYSAIASDLERTAGDIPSLRGKLLILDEQIVIAEAAMCPTCEQPWVTEKAAKHLANIRVDRNSHAERLENAEKAKDMLAHAKQLAQAAEVKVREYRSEELTAAVEKRTEVERQMYAAKQAIASERGEYDLQIRIEETNFAQELAAVTAKMQADDQVIDNENSQKLTVLRNNVVNAEKFRREYEMGLAETRKELAIVQGRNASKVAHREAALATRERLETQILATKEEAVSLLDQSNAERDFAELVGREGFLGSIFEEVLVEISQEANKLLAALPNVATTTIEFVTESETKKGTTKRSITPIVYKGGVSIPLESGLSGGQLTSAELAVDLAVMTVIGRRTGTMPGWLILDESFGDGHDVPVMEACLEILKRAAEDRLILLVSHATEIKDQIEFTIDVESTGDTSRIVA